MNSLFVISKLKERIATGDLPGHRQNARLADGVFLFAENDFIVVRVQRENRIYTSLPVIRYCNDWHLVDDLTYLISSFVRWINRQEENYDNLVMLNERLAQRPTRQQ